jgi:hypothetical protein
MVEKVLQKIGGNSGYGTFTVVDKGDGSVDRRASMPVPATAVGTATLTTAQILNGFLIGTPVAAAAYTLPLAADLDAAVKMDIGEAFEFHIRNDGVTGTVDHITVTTNTGWTLSGPMVIHQANSPAAGESTFGHFIARKTAAAAFTLYRVGA